MNNLQPINSSALRKKTRREKLPGAAVNIRGSLSSVEINPTGRMRELFFIQYAPLSLSLLWLRAIKVSSCTQLFWNSLSHRARWKWRGMKMRELLVFPSSFALSDDATRSFVWCFCASLAQTKNDTGKLAFAESEKKTTRGVRGREFSGGVSCASFCDNFASDALELKFSSSLSPRTMAAAQGMNMRHSHTWRETNC